MKDFVLDFKQYQLKVKNWYVRPYYEAVGLAFDHEQLKVEYANHDFAHWLGQFSLDDAKDFYLFPVVAHIHSGIKLRLYTKEGFDQPIGLDDTFGGFVVVDKFYYDSQEEALTAAEELLVEWNFHLDGDVYQYHYKTSEVCKTCGEIHFNDSKPSDYKTVYGSENLQACILEDFEDLLEDHIDDKTDYYVEFTELLNKQLS